MNGSPGGAQSRTLILDAHDYARRVLLQGARTPGEPVAHARFLAQIVALLRPSVSLLDLGTFVEGLVAADHALAGRVSGSRRATAAIRTVLAEEAIAAQVGELVRVSAAMSPVPLAVQLPSPVRWLVMLTEQYGCPAAAAEEAENASVYLADWLRRLAVTPIDMVVLDGRSAPAGESLGDYDPLTRTAVHYRWRLGLRREDGLEMADGEGAVLPSAFWTDPEAELPSSAAAVIVSRVDPDAPPEAVLAARARLG